MKRAAVRRPPVQIMDNSYKPSSGGVEPDICPTAFTPEEEGGKVTYIPIDDFAAQAGISVQAVRKRIASGKLTAKKVEDERQPNGKWMIAVATVATNPVATVATNPVATVATNPVATVATVETEVVKSQDSVSESGRDTGGGMRSGALASARTSDALTKARTDEVFTSVVLDKKEGAITDKQQIIAIRRAQVCEAVLGLQKKESLSLSKAMDDYLGLYNQDLDGSVVFATLGSISASTLRRWVNMYKKGSKSWTALIPQWKGGKQGHTVPQADLNWLVGILHSDGKPTVSSALRLWHTKLRMEGRKAPVSDRTMERAINRVAEKYGPRWNYMRRGAKYFRENYLPHVLIDGSQVAPGDLWFSDGCVCNFDVINPYTGKACRPTFIPFMDFSSRMIVGFDLDFTENRRVIASAYRNAITLWGFVPRFIKWDNGRAYRSLSGKKLSRAEREDIKQLEADEIADILGSIYATGVEEVLNSLPYNPTGKANLERFFGTFDNGLERWLPGYRGAGVGDKPASLQRNEKHLQELSQKLKGRQTLTIMEAKLLINWWIMEVYAQSPHEGLNGRTPWEVWQDGLQNIDSSRRRDPQELWYLMLAQEEKKLDRNGVRVAGIWYYHESLVDYVGQRVFVRYDQMDDRWVMVFDQYRQPICRAEARREHSPIATVAGTEEDKLALTHELKRRRQIEKKYKTAADQLVEQMKGSDDFLQEAWQKVQEQKEDQVPQLTDTSYALPELPDVANGGGAASAGYRGESEMETKEDKTDVIIPKEFMDAIGLG